MRQVWGRDQEGLRVGSSSSVTAPSLSSSSTPSLVGAQGPTALRAQVERGEARGPEKAGWKHQIQQHPEPTGAAGGPGRASECRMDWPGQWGLENSGTGCLFPTNPSSPEGPTQEVARQTDSLGRGACGPLVLTLRLSLPPHEASVSPAN